jgi:hypothetical protein
MRADNAPPMPLAAMGGASYPPTAAFCPPMRLAGMRGAFPAPVRRRDLGLGAAALPR